MTETYAELQAALDRVLAAARAHLDAVLAAEGVPDDDAVWQAYVTLNNASHEYDELLNDACGEVTPWDLETISPEQAKGRPRPAAPRRRDEAGPPTTRTPRWSRCGSGATTGCPACRPCWSWLSSAAGRRRTVRCWSRSPRSPRRSSSCCRPGTARSGCSTSTNSNHSTASSWWSTSRPGAGRRGRRGGVPDRCRRPGGRPARRADGRGRGLSGGLGAGGSGYGVSAGSVGRLRWRRSRIWREPSE